MAARRKHGLQLDRLLLTTDENYTPTGFGPTESNRYLAGSALPVVPLERTLVYTYDHLYRLTEADYHIEPAFQTTAFQPATYAYAYDAVGNRLEEIINGDTTTYLYDAANRLLFLNGEPVYEFDANGNLLARVSLANTFDAANRLTDSTNSTNSTNSLTPHYDGLGNRVGQTAGGVTTDFALDVVGLPEVIYTSEGNAYLHLPGVIMTESSTGQGKDSIFSA